MGCRAQYVLTGLILCSLPSLFFYYKEEIWTSVSIKLTTNYIFNNSSFDSVIWSIDNSYDDNISLCVGVSTIQRAEYNISEIITSCADFLGRVGEYNIAIDVLRNETLRRRNPEEWHGAQGGATVDVVWGANDDFLQQLGKYPDVQTVSLPWLGTRSSNWSSLNDTSNLLIQKYYEWTASDMLCKWVETPGTIKMKYDAVFNRTCHRFLNDTGNPISLPPVFLYMKPINSNHYWPNQGNIYPVHFYHNTTPYVFYMHIVADAIVTELGDVYAPHVKIVPYSCQFSKDPIVPRDANKRPLYDEVFVIAQFWGTAVFHRMGEIVPRLAGWLHFLRQNQQIKIFTGEEKRGRLGEIMKILGLNPDRIVTQWGRAKVAYIPRASHCGMPSVQESQIVSSEYRRHVEKVIGAQPRNRLVLIRRTGQRRFTEQLEIEKVLQRLAKKYGLIFEMFIDNPVPSFNHTMRMFHAAVMVVAPHGAGLANIYFSQPGTYVIEGVCNLPHVNFCFQRLAVILGHHWHGIPSRGGCEGVVDVSAKDIESTALQYIQLHKLNKINQST